MLGNLPHLLIEFAVQTVIFVALLWVMIKIQKLDQHSGFSFLGVLGTAALVTGLDMALDRTVGRFLGAELASYITVPISSTVLFLCLKKVTGAPFVDIIFTAAISYALMFAVNLFILGSLMGDLRPTASNPDESETDTQRQETAAEPQPASRVNPPTPTAPTNSVKPSPAKPVEKAAAAISIKGVTRNAAKSTVMIQTGTKSYTLFLGESLTVQTADGPVPVRFSDLGENWVTLEIGGEPVKYPVH